MKENIALCDRFIDSISELAAKKGVSKVVLHGEHENSLFHVNMMMAVDNLSEFAMDGYQDIGIAALQHGMYGAVEAKNASLFNNSFEEMENFYRDKSHFKRYIRKGQKLVPA